MHSKYPRFADEAKVCSDARHVLVCLGHNCLIQEGKPEKQAMGSGFPRRCAKELCVPSDVLGWSRCERKRATRQAGLLQAANPRQDLCPKNREHSTKVAKFQEQAGQSLTRPVVPITNLGGYRFIDDVVHRTWLQNTKRLGEPYALGLDSSEQNLLRVSNQLSINQERRKTNWWSHRLTNRHQKG